MTKKIFKSNILVAAAVLIFGIACVMAILYQHFGKQINTELKKEAAPCNNRLLNSIFFNRRIFVQEIFESSPSSSKSPDASTM